MLDFKVLSPDEQNLELIEADRFGFSPDARDNSPAFRLAFERMQKGGFKLVFKKGVYRFDSSDWMVLKNACNIVVDGNGSEFVFSDTGYFHVQNCSLIHFKNMTIDWNWEKRPIGDIARITRTEELFFEAQFFLVDGIEPFTEVDNVYGYDSEKLIPGYNSKMYVFGTNKIRHCEKTGEKNTLRIYPEPGSFSGIEKGETYLFRFLGYGRSLFLIESSSNVTISDSMIYGVYGMAFIISGYSHHYRVSQVRIGLREKEPRRRISVSVDGFHVSSSTGYGIVEDCDFSFLGDDFINIHDSISFCEKADSEQVMTVEGNVTYSAGDIVEVIDEDFSKERARLEVSNIRIIDRLHAILEFTEKIPEKFRGLTVIHNIKYDSGHYIIRNNHFHKSRARGMLLQASNGMVTNNVIEQITGAGVYVMHEILKGYWYEGHGAQNIIIRDNIFRECNLNDWFSVIDIRAEMFSSWEASARNPLTRTEKKRSCALFEDIVVEENLFDNCPSLAFYLYVANNITILNNRMINDRYYKLSGESRGMILQSGCTNIHISGNQGEINNYCKNPFGILPR